MTTNYEFTMETLAEDAGICCRELGDCTDEILAVCTPEPNMEHLFLADGMEFKVSYDTNGIPTISVGEEVFTPDYRQMEDTAEWVLDILGSAAVVLLTQGKLHSVATEWVFELKEGLPSINISTKMLMKHLSKENRIVFFKLVRNAMKNSFIKWDDEDSLINDEAGIFAALVNAGISSSAVPELTAVFSIEELHTLVREFNEAGKYEYQLFVTEVLRTIPQEELDKRWEL